MKLKAFSLVELMVVLTIIGILAAAALTVIKPQKFFADSRDGRRQSDLKVVQTALEQFYAQNYHYPEETDASENIVFGQGWSVSGSTYLRLVPNDPQSPSKNYCYERIDSVNYLLCANLEETSSTNVTCKGVSHNYCLSNPF